MAAPVGVATWVLHGHIPPASGFGSLTASVGATLGAPGFVLLVAAFAAVVSAALFLIVWWLRRDGGVSTDGALFVTAPMAWGLALPMLAPLLDAVAFWCTAPPLAALGVCVGALVSARRWAGVARSGSLTSVATERAAVAGLAAALPLFLLVAGWSPPSGDEPNYLVVAHSLVSDADLDLADDFSDRSYASFHPSVLSPHYRPGQRDGSRYSMHGVGLPVLVAPAYALGATLGGGAEVALPRAVLCLLFGIFAWGLHGLVHEVSCRRAALHGTLATAVLAPLVFAPLYLFPEVPAMVLSLVAFRGLRTAAGGETRYGLALALLPFVGVKYIPLSVALLIVGVWAAPGRRRARLLRVGGGLAAGLLIHALFTWSLYGSLSPAAIYLGAGEQSGAPALGGDWGAYLAAWPAALATATGYLLDQKEGLLAYGPHFLLAVAGMASMWRHQRRTVLSLGLVAAAYLGPYALSQQLGGQGPPVRPLMAVLWVLAPALGIALTMRTEARWYAALRSGLVALGLMLTVAYAALPELLPHDYPVVASRLLQNYSPYGSDWWRLFPQWVNIEDPNWGVTTLWTLVVLAVAVALWRLGGRDAGGNRQPDGSPVSAAGPGDAELAARGASFRVAVATVALACSFVLLHHLLVVRTDRHRPTPLGDGMVAWVAEELPPVAFAEPGGIWATPGAPIDAVLTSDAELESIDVSLRVLVPAEVAASVQGVAAGGNGNPGDNLLARLRLGSGRPDGDGYAYQVRIQASRGAAPADVFGGADERYLGVFLEVVGRAVR